MQLTAGCMPKTWVEKAESSSAKRHPHPDRISPVVGTLAKPIALNSPSTPTSYAGTTQHAEDEDDIAKSMFHVPCIALAMHCPVQGRSSKELSAHR